MPGFLLFLLFLAQSGFSSGPFCSGKFYPSSREELLQFVDSSFSLKNDKAVKKEEIAGILVPHAGYQFSGRLAALAYSAVSDDYEVVVIFGTGHYFPVEGAALPAASDFETPLGKVKTDSALAGKLLKASALFKELPAAFVNEHSVEVQLPFLQRKIKNNFTILPVLMNSAGPVQAAEIGRLIGKSLRGKKALIVASSDLSHYPSSLYSRASDLALLRALSSMDEDYFYLAGKLIESKKTPGLSVSACGLSAVTAALAASKELGAGSFKLLARSDSYLENKKYGNFGHVVGYGAGLFLKVEKELPLTPTEEKDKIFEIARKAVEGGLKGGKPVLPENIYLDWYLNIPAAVFVTITEEGRLRGCVGSVFPSASLGDAAASSAYSAAFEDSRFPPLSAREFDKIKFEISILSPLKKVKGVEDIKNGKGVLLSCGTSSGLFLPQVWKDLPEKKLFLSELCSQKAGLPRDCWKKKEVAFYVFEAEILKGK